MSDFQPYRQRLMSFAADVWAVNYPAGFGRETGRPPTQYALTQAGEKELHAHRVANFEKLGDAADQLRIETATVLASLSADAKDEHADPVSRVQSWIHRGIELIDPRIPKHIDGFETDVNGKHHPSMRTTYTVATLHDYRNWKSEGAAMLEWFGRKLDSRKREASDTAKRPQTQAQNDPKAEYNKLIRAGNDDDDARRLVMDKFNIGARQLRRYLAR